MAPRRGQARLSVTQAFAGGRVAAMPSVGRVTQLGVAGGIATVLLGASASRAAAGDVVLWACHGPTGQLISSSFEFATNNDGQVVGSANGTPFDDKTTARCGGAAGDPRVEFTSADPRAGSSARVQ